ncbi:hypothetical protein SAMN05216359_12210 [Roseateles sp. YR242]|uniref:hypothetical protein n=1 Tax=Roseateles sp. YR242 TaxID=1855305 RepID=UPI0008AE6A9F|nr:hypothetical protein [Roseateles sp. YR242]SEL89175.1 hypothetical protein SAMN05216359_12210 [Roseateles sp. YR242]
MTTPFRPYGEASLNYYLQGFAKAYIANEVSVQEDEVPEDMQAPYRDGLQDGERCAVEGFPVEPTFYDLREGVHHPVVTAAEGLDIAAEMYGVGHAIWKGLLGAAFFETAVLALMVSIAATQHFQEAAAAVRPTNYVEFANFLGSIADPVSIELFVGGGVDENEEGRELQMTSVFKTLEEARQAVLALGRPKYIICSLRTDMSGGMRLVERSEE